MSTNVDPEQLKALAQEIQDLLNQLGIDAEKFNLGIRISSDFYHSVKENFPNRHPSDVMVGSSEENWSISLIRPQNLQD